MCLPRIALFPWRGPGSSEALGRHNEAAPLAAQPATEDLLGAPDRGEATAEGIDVRRVDEGDPSFGGPVEDGHRHRLVALQPEGHGAEAEFGDEKSGAAEVDVVHGTNGTAAGCAYSYSYCWIASSPIAESAPDGRLLPLPPGIQGEVTVQRVQRGLGRRDQVDLGAGDAHTIVVGGKRPEGDDDRVADHRVDLGHAHQIERDDVSQVAQGTQRGFRTADQRAAAGAADACPAAEAQVHLADAVMLVELSDHQGDPGHIPGRDRCHGRTPPLPGSPTRSGSTGWPLALRSPGPPRGRGCGRRGRRH